MFARIILVSFLSALLSGAISKAAEEEMPPRPPSSAEFERLKGLVGEWEGTSVKDGKEEKVKVRYELTSGGSVLLERFCVGTPSEMVSVYHDRAGRLEMTHYCMLGNQPRMVLNESSGTNWKFQLAADTDIDVAHEQHMHGLEISLADGGGQMNQSWNCYKEGAKDTDAVFSFTRLR
ncbi:MAG: hypothetical protein HYY14_07165 [Candidatus Omnitrophica bacterium]|nr:hypothetical protein [Candidatus Omnitrophota bacterium]